MASADSSTTNIQPLLDLIQNLNSSTVPNYVPPGLDPVTSVDSKDVTIDSDTNVQARLYLPPGAAGKKLPVLVYFHGGGFLLGDSQAFSPKYHNFLNAIAAQANVLAVAVNYRLSQQAKLPAAWDDSMAALKWVFSPAPDPWLAEHGDFTHVCLVGDSAGANIAHNMAMQLEANGIPPVEGVALLCPYFWGSKLLDGESIIYTVFFTGAWLLAMSPGMSLDDPRVNPVTEGAPSLAGLGCKKVFVCTGGTDPLRWRGHAYIDGLIGSGWPGKVEAKEYEGMGHVFFFSNLESEESKDMIAKVVALFNPTRVTN